MRAPRPMSVAKSVSLLAACLAWPASLVAQTARDRAVEINASVQESPPAITLQWNAASSTPLGQKIYRRLKGEKLWAQIAAPPPAATSHADSAVSRGVEYEYFVVRTSNAPLNYALGYVSAGIHVPVVHDRGRVILLVDDTMAVPLAAELALFADDLTGDGWEVVRQDISRAASAVSVRAAIQSIFQFDPANTVALILFGHIPVPYSGDAAADGHPDHFGAWPADLYYGDMDGTWTDTTINDTSASQSRHRNVPGDGKFDQTIIPSDIELQIGRIDFANMDLFPDNETERLRRYLTRDHSYRHKAGAFANVPRRGLVDDNFGFFGGEAFAVVAWRSFTACAGAGSVQSGNWFPTLETQSYLWAYGCGAGDYTSAANVASSTDFRDRTSLAVFNVLFGSYFGDWESTNNFLRAPLVGNAASLGLVSCWSGRPHWQFQHMALGETVGYSARVTQNNDGSLQHGYDSNYFARCSHIALLGDPTLRLYPVNPPSNLAASAAGQAVNLTWNPSADSALEGYLISRASSPGGSFVRLSAALPSATSFVDCNVTPGAEYRYRVRAVKLETSPTGTFQNPSQGAFSTMITAPAASGPEINVGGNGNPISAGDTEFMAANGTDFGPINTVDSAVCTFTVTNAGAGTLNLDNAVITGANAADFTITRHPPATLAPGASATFEVQFHPSIIGMRTATFGLTTNDADEASFQFAIGGTGLPAPAAIAIYPPLINRSIHSGETVVETLRISDPGPGALAYSISSSLTSYSARDSDSFGGPAYNWIEISATGTEITGWANNDDAICAPIPIGFSFPFYGGSFSSVRVCTNGFLSFTDSAAGASNTPLPNLSAAANMVAFLWTDLLLDGGSHVYQQNVGGNFVVQFENIALFGGDATTRVTCEAILKPTGEIVLQYKNLVQLGNNYTLGIQNGSRDDALLIASKTAYLHDAMAIRIRPPGLETWLNLSASSGTVPPGGTQSISATLNTTGLGAGAYYAELTVSSNTAENPTMSIPVQLSIGATPIEVWRMAHFGSAAGSGDAADLADPDGDARNNLLEYALVNDPAIYEADGPPWIGINPAGYLQMQFDRDTIHTDLSYLVQAASNPTGAWTTIASGVHGSPLVASGAHSCQESGAGSVKTVTVEDVQPAVVFTTRYLRLQVFRD